MDLTGYWVSVVTEDWRFRMVTPPKGDYASVPLTPEARKIADGWDPSTDGSCLAYAAAGALTATFVSGLVVFALVMCLACAPWIVQTRASATAQPKGVVDSGSCQRH